MKVQTFDINGLMLFTPPRFEDSRGFFSEFYKSAREFSKILTLDAFYSENLFPIESWSTPRATRPINPQQAKLVTCTQGKILT